MIGGSTMLSSTVLGNQIYYVSQTVNGCESERIAVQVTLKLVLCSGAKVSDLTVIGGVNISWYTSLTTTTVLGLSTILSNRTYYYSQTNEEGVTARKAVIVTLDLVSNPTSITGASGTVCYGSGKILNLNASMVRGTIQWQSASIATGPFAPIVGATTTTMDTGSLNATTYFNAVVTNGVCPSKTTTTVAVTVRSQALSGSISGGGVVCSGTNSTKLTLSGYLGSIQWQSSTNNIDFVTILPSVASASYTALKITATTYYRVLVTNGLECIPVISESVMINVKSKPNAGYVTGPTLIPYNTAATLSLTGYEVGSTLQWKYGLTSSGTYFKGGQVINTSPIYTTAKLTKDYYYKVTVTKDGCSSDTAPFLADVNTAKFEDNTEKAAVFDVVGYPNPFSNYFTLDVTSPIKEPIVLTVFDLTGRLIETRQVQSTEIANQEIGKGYPSGVYNVLFTQEGNSKLLKMIKK